MIRISEVSTIISVIQPSSKVSGVADWFVTDRTRREDDERAAFCYNSPYYYMWLPAESNVVIPYKMEYYILVCHHLMVLLS